MAGLQPFGLRAWRRGITQTGGGFGGCTVSLVKAAAANEIASKVCDCYRKQTGVEATAFATTPSQGALVLQCA